MLKRRILQLAVMRTCGSYVSDTQIITIIFKDAWVIIIVCKSLFKMGEKECVSVYVSQGVFLHV